MVKMRLLTSVVGDGFTWVKDEVVNVDEETARKWCDGVRAERVAERPKRGGRRAKVENTALRPPEDRGGRPQSTPREES